MNLLAMMPFYDEQEVLIKQAADKAYDKWGCPELSDITTFEWNKKFKSRAADAKFDRRRDKGRIRMSIDIWPHLSETERYETAVHEAAHVAATYLQLRTSEGTIDRHRRVLRVGHGLGWKRLMWQMELKATRCHTVDTFALGISKKRKTKRFIYQCGCPDGMWCGPKSHKNIQRGYTIYQCTKAKHTVNSTTPFVEGVKE